MLDKDIPGPMANSTGGAARSAGGFRAPSDGASDQYPFGCGSTRGQAEWRALTYATVRYEVADGIATIAMDQPDARNALSDELLADLVAAFEAARDDDAVRCAVLASTHETTFSAGGNLAGFAADVPLVHKHLATERFPRLFTLIGELGKPVLCAVNGHCLAGALGLALACDLIIASERATFGTPEINVGVFPFMILALIVRNVPRKKAVELLLLGERLDAHEAERLGIVNRVVAPEAFDEAVGDWATKLAAKSPLLMKLGKDALWRQNDMTLEDAWDYLRAQLTIAFSTEDIQEGVQAFFEKREPQWKGR
jgi:enoyl-CoA hydratase/carnithine racemase